MLLLDGQSYDVDVLSIKRKAEFLDKYAERTESGDLERELIGVYFNYQLKLAPSTNPTEYDRLWEKLTEAEEFHTVTVPYPRLLRRALRAELHHAGRCRSAGRYGGRGELRW